MGTSGGRPPGRPHVDSLIEFRSLPA
jgi:hypothetical protein